MTHLTRQRHPTLDDLGTPLRDVTFVVVDLETTGGSPQQDAITEIGAVKVRAGEVLGEFATLVDPERGVPPAIVELTGITDTMLVAAPRLDEVLPSFLEFAAGAVLVAHNAPFDVGFLRAACADRDRAWPKTTVLCTARLARRVLSRDEAPICRLGALATLLGATTRPVHRALADARATVDVLHALLERVGGLGVHSLEELMGYLPDVGPQRRRRRHLADAVPTEPGVYLFRGPGDEVLYVGTSADLRSRVRQYFTASETRPRIREMVLLAERVDTVSCAHALEAQVRELRLLAAHRPHYNRRSTNPDLMWWVVITDEPLPRLSVVRAPRDDAMGPFHRRDHAFAAVDALHDVVAIRRCTERLSPRKPRSTACVLADLGRCGAPCTGAQSVQAYGAVVDRIRALVSGDDDTVLGNLVDRATDLAAAHRFEDAALHRDRTARLVRNLSRGQRLAALAGIGELVAARPDGAGGWEFAVVRYGRLASSGVARRGVAPMPVVEQLVASAEYVQPGPGPLRGGRAEETRLVHAWLTRPGTRLVRTDRPWSEPVASASRWTWWLRRAESSRVPRPEGG